MNQGTTTLTNVTVSGNTAAVQGGGIVNAAGPPPLFGQLQLTHVTNVGNSAPAGGGLAASSGTVRLRATILASNPGGNCAGPPPVRTSQGFNLSSDGSCNFTGTGDRNNTDPQVEPLANQGGFAPTHALRSNSPAIDAVLTGCPPPATDQRNLSRPRDGNSDGAALCDIGAFEFAPTGAQAAADAAVAAATAAQAVNDPNNDDEEDVARQRRRTRNSATRGEDEFRTEGNVVGVRCTASDPVPELNEGFIVEPDMLPYALIANRDEGAQKILLIKDAAKLCGSIRVGDYLEAEGEKQSEALFHADDVSIQRKR